MGKAEAPKPKAATLICSDCGGGRSVHVTHKLWVAFHT